MNDIKISFGTNCQDPFNPLIQIDLFDAYKYIKEGNNGLIAETKMLRKVINMDRNRYRVMKTRLPYISCCQFIPPIRKVNNFVGAVGLIIDIDWTEGIDKTKLENIISDPRVAMLYRSPSGLGVKVVLLFDKLIRGAQHYTQVHQTVAHDFGRQYNLLDVIDFKNSDASRISFLSYDTEAYYNDFPKYIDTEQNSTGPKEGNYENSKSVSSRQIDLPIKIYQEILRKLDTRSSKNISTDPMILENVKALMPTLKQELNLYGIKLKVFQTMLYGAKIILERNEDIGEVNIYFGKKGYIVMSTAKKANQSHLSNIAKNIISSILNRY